MVYKIIKKTGDLILLAISYLFPRNNNIWCFGSDFVGNAKYLSIYLKETQSTIRIIWISEGNEVIRLRELGFEAYERWSLKGVWYSLIAGAYFYDSYPYNVNLYTIGRAKKVNLWHGVGLKKMDRQIKAGPLAKYYQSKGIINELRYLGFRMKPDLMLSTSPFQTRHFIEAVEVTEDHFIEAVYPRCEIFKKSESNLLDYIKKYETKETYSFVENLRNYSYVYIYMPTFRDSGDDFIKQCGFDFDKVNSSLKEHNRFLILKMHPDSKLDFSNEYSNIVIVPKDIDIYPVLPFTSCLITDYSSIYFDYLLMKDKHIILFIPDYNDYISKSRDLAHPYDKYTKGLTAKTFEELFELFNRDFVDIEMPDLNSIRSTFWAPKYTNLNQLVYILREKID